LTTPPNLPIAVLVNFDNYAGPPLFHDHPKYVPIPQLFAEGPTGGGQCQCKETKEKNHRDRNISFSMLKCSQFPGGYFLADEQYPSYSNVY